MRLTFTRFVLMSPSRSSFVAVSIPDFMNDEFSMDICVTDAVSSAQLFPTQEHIESILPLLRETYANRNARSKVVREKRQFLQTAVIGEIIGSVETAIPPYNKESK